MKIVNSESPMLAINMIEFIESQGRAYLKTVKENKTIAEAVVVDFINYVAVSQCIDYSMYVSDLKNEDENMNREWYLNIQLANKIIMRNAERYANDGISKSVLQNNHMNDIKKSFDESLGKKIIKEMLSTILIELEQAA